MSTPRFELPHGAMPLPSDRDPAAVAQLRDAIAAARVVAITGASADARARLAAAALADHPAPVYWLRIRDAVVPEVGLGFLAAACGSGGVAGVPAAAWNDRAQLEACGRRIAAALAAEAAVLVVELDDAAPGADAPRWAVAVGALADAVPLVLVGGAAALGLARRAVAIALDGPTVASARGELELALVAAGSEVGRHAELEARWRRSPGEVWQRAAALAALVRGACRSHTVGWAADVLAGGAVASLRRACPALVERLAAMTLGAGEVSRLHAVVLTDLRAAHWYELGEVAVAVALYRAALAHARAADVPRLVCLALNNLGNALVATDAPAALACFTEAIERARVAGLIDEELITLNNLCVTLMDTGALDDAGEVFDVAIRRVDETGRWQTFGNVIVGNLGTLYGRTAHAAMARAFLERAMTVALAAGDTAMWAAWLGNLVALMVAQDEPAVDAQLIAYGEQLQAARAGGDPEVRADAAWLLAFAHLRRGRGEEASAIALASAERSEAEGAARQALDALDLAMVAQVGAPAALEPLLARRRRLLASDASIDAGAAVEQLAALAVRIGIPATGVDDLRRRVAPGSHR